MVEVFKTTVDNLPQAYRLLEAMHRAFPGYQINFDLDDCDNILRVENTLGEIDTCSIVNLFISHGSFAEVLKDEVNFRGTHIYS